MSSIYVFDLTVKDQLSKVRGVGRYMQLLKENFSPPAGGEFTFTDNLNLYRQGTALSLLNIFINPFFEFLKPPLTTKRIAHKQIAVIHDLIRFKYPKHFPIGIKGRINIYLNKIALKAYDVVITDSEQSKKDIINILKIPENRVKVIYPCLPKIFDSTGRRSATPTNSRYSLPTTNYCLYVGDITWNKNLVNLAKAIKIADVSCVFVGKNFTPNVGDADLRPLQRPLQHPELQEFRNFLKEVKDDKRFIFKGFVEDSELIKLYQQARVNILVSRDEGFGLSYLESASFGIPSVLSNIPVFKELALDTSLYADFNKPEDIADKIKQVFSNENLRQTLGQKAYERSSYFTQDKFKQEWMKILS